MNTNKIVNIIINQIETQKLFNLRHPNARPQHYSHYIKYPNYQAALDVKTLLEAQGYNVTILRHLQRIVIVSD